MNEREELLVVLKKGIYTLSEQEINSVKEYIKRLSEEKSNE